MLEDHDGNMWFGSSDSGVLEFDRNGFEPLVRAIHFKKHT
jgi:hypothetical protein